jgi:hypothetical protein
MNNKENYGPGPNKKSSIIRRLKTTAIALPILTLFLTTRFFYFILCLSKNFITKIVVNYIIYEEYYIISTNIMKALFVNENMKMTYNVFSSFALTKYIFMLCPIVLYAYPGNIALSIMVK